MNRMTTKGRQEQVKLWRLWIVGLLAIFIFGCDRGVESQSLQTTMPDLERGDERRVLARSCDAGVMDDCLALAAALGLQPLDPATSPGLPVADRACRAGGHAASCTRLAWLWDPVTSTIEAPFSEVFLERSANAESYWTLLCERNDSFACDRLVQRESVMARAVTDHEAELQAEAAERERLRLQEAERLRQAQVQRELEAAIRHGFSNECGRMYRERGVDQAVCETLMEAIRNGRTSSAGRSSIQEYLRSRGVSRLNGFIVARIEAGLYEAMRRSYDPYWDISYPRGQHFLLRTEFTDYTSRGRFSMWVEEDGQQTITTTSGFVEVWTIYRESALGGAWQFVRDARAGDETSMTASQLLLALMGDR
jgi:hypothetical protein